MNGRGTCAPGAAMLFAAGYGTRMRPLTDTRPKPLISVAGRPLIDHALALADGAGATRIVANAHYLADQIVAHLAGRPDIAVSVEAPDIVLNDFDQTLLVFGAAGERQGFHGAAKRCQRVFYFMGDIGGETLDGLDPRIQGIGHFAQRAR